VLNAQPCKYDMYKSNLRHIHDPVLSSLKMKGIRLLFFSLDPKVFHYYFVLKHIKFLHLIWLGEYVKVGGRGRVVATTQLLWLRYSFVLCEVKAEAEEIVCKSS
jgi:hypothetical protein